MAPNLSANQAEAYWAARKAGKSDKVARALVANLTGEALHKPADVHWDVSHTARGIAQWDPSRSEAIKSHFGKYPNELSVAVQTQAVIWEIETVPRFAPTRRALAGNDEHAMIDALVRNYEVPANPGAAIAQRAAFMARLPATFPGGPPSPLPPSPPETPPLERPTGVPVPLIEALLWLLGNACGGFGTTLLGLGGLAYAYLPQIALDTPTRGVVTILSVALIFGAGGHGIAKQPALAPVFEHEPELEQLIEKDMPMLDPKIIVQLIEALVPLLAEIVPLLQKLEPTIAALNNGQSTIAQRLEALETLIASSKNDAGAATNGLADAIAKLNQLTTALRSGQ